MKSALRMTTTIVVLYCAIASISLLSSWAHYQQVVSTSVLQNIESTPENALLFAVVFVCFTYAMIRFSRATRIALPVILVIALVSGAQFVYSAWLSLPASIGFALAGVTALSVIPRVWIHNIITTLGVSGIAGLLGTSLSPLVACALLALFAIYDIVSVYRTKHMIVMANHMLSSGIIFGFLVPTTFRGLLLKKADALNSNQVMMLGSGDVTLPLILAISVLRQSTDAAVIIVLFSLVGVLVMQWLFLRQKEAAPMAALPPIALSAILGYLCSIVLGL